MDREEFVARLEKRGESPENITVRMAKIDKELAERTLFDKIIVNKMGRLENTVRSMLRYAARCHHNDALADTRAKPLRSLMVDP
jgi:guanylate kinase